MFNSTPIPSEYHDKDNQNKLKQDAVANQMLLGWMLMSDEECLECIEYCNKLIKCERD